MPQDFTTLICLFHHKTQAHAALEDILKAGVPEANVTLIGDEGSRIAATADSLKELNVPARDLQHLLDGLQGGGVVLTVSAISTLADKVDEIFKAHKADKFDEAVIADDMSGVDTLGQTDGDGEDLLLVEDRAAGLVYVVPVLVEAADPAVSEDVDPRELGLDARMHPVKTENNTPDIDL